MIYADRYSLLHELIEASIVITLKKYEICGDCEECKNFISMDKQFPDTNTGVCYVATVLSLNKSEKKLSKYIKKHMKEVKSGELFILESCGRLQK